MKKMRRFMGSITIKSYRDIANLEIQGLFSRYKIVREITETEDGGKKIVLKFYEAVEGGDI